MQSTTTTTRTEGKTRGASRQRSHLTLVNGSNPRGHDVQKSRKKSTQEDSGKLLTFSFTIPAKVAPATRSAIEKISNEVGGRLTGNYAFPAEQALTDAAIGLGHIRAAICKQVRKGDANYPSGRFYAPKTKTPPRAKSTAADERADAA